MNAEEFVQSQIKRVPSFTLGVVGSVEEGKSSVTSGGRSAARTGLGRVLAETVTPGATAIMLGGGENDQTQILGFAPFLGG